MKNVPIEDLRESDTNPRKTFDKKAMTELTQSVATHGVLAPILTTPDGTIVAGARRFRAAKAAGLKKIPAVQKKLTDDQVRNIQLVENLQREDIHPFEEAEGLEQLRELGRSVEEIAAGIGKSKASVYARLKLCDLSPQARKLCLQHDIDASRSLLIARIPTPKLQLEAAKEIAGFWRGGGRGEPLSYRSAAELVQTHFMLRLKDAPFNVKDAELVPRAGACGECPHRTGNQAELYADVGNADVCTMPSCFDKKRKAHVRQFAKKKADTGHTVLTGTQGKDALRSAKFTRLDQYAQGDPQFRTWRALTKKQKLEKVYVVEGDQITELVKTRDARAAARANGFLKKTAPATKGKARKGESRADMKAKHELREKVVRATLPLMDTCVVDFNQQVLVAIALELAWGCTDGGELALEYHGLKIRDRARTKKELAKIDDTTKLYSLIAMLVACNEVSYPGAKDYGEEWKDICDALGIDYKDIEAQIVEDAKELTVTGGKK